MRRNIHFLAITVACTGLLALPTSDTSAGSRKAPPAGGVIELGLAYLVNQQHSDGGWGQGGGWRQLAGRGRSNPKANPMAERSDVGNTASAILALIQAGHSPTKGKYNRATKRGVQFICKKISESKPEELFVTDVRNTQLQMKIGQYVDTFIAAQALAKVKGQMGSKSEEGKLGQCLDQVIAKIETHQREDGSFAGNHGWASVLSQGLATRGLNLARSKGARVSEKSLARAQKQAERGYDSKTNRFGAMSGSSDAGVGIYGSSATLGGLTDSVRTGKKLKQKAAATLESFSASEESKAEAREQLDRLDRAVKTQRAAKKAVVKQLGNARYVAGFGSNGGEEFLSYLNISETLAMDGDKEWDAWSNKMSTNLGKIQNKDGSWAGHHCITGRTFVTATALMVLMTKPNSGD